MTTKILEDLIVNPVGELAQKNLAGIRASAEAMGIFLTENPEDERIKGILREKFKEMIMHGSPQERAEAWMRGNPVVGTIEWHLKRADERLQAAWEEAIGDVLDEWRKNEGDIGQVSHGQLLAVLEILGGSLLPRLNSIAAVNAPAEPEVKPKVTAEQVITALKKKPDLFQEVREGIIASMRVIEERSWERVPLRGDVTTKLPIEIPDEFPSGPVTIRLDTAEYWPPNITITGEFHVIGGELDVPMERPSSRFPMIRTAHLERGPHRKIVVHIRSSHEGYMNGVELEVFPHVG